MTLPGRPGGAAPPGLGATPYAVVAAAERVDRGDKTALVALSRSLERQALVAPPTVVAAALQDARFLTPATLGVYTRLADAGVRTRLFARGLTSYVAPGVDGVALDDDDPLVDEWVIVLPGERPAVFAATDLREPCDSDLERCFLYAVSHDPEVVQECLRLLVPDLAV
ncbi:MAG: Phytochrome-like protein cph2 [Frankiales bacterium]|nr:Phytochrome-like protein cph2 [Frankiales bacterium]